MTLILLLIVIFFFLLFVILEGFRLDTKYQEDITYLESYIERAEVCKRNFDFIVSMFDVMTRNNKDEKRTALLWCRFLGKYYEFWKDELKNEIIKDIQKRIA